jgi:pyridinium-3,5-bisthiocarboxylic acid mononucleotide nickel chelatase
MRVAIFDPYSGASGDMMLGALIDVGAPLADLNALLSLLHLPGVSVSAERAEQHGIHGTRVTVHEGADQPERTWSAIRTLIERSELSASVKERAISIFEKLARAEAKVHGSSLEQVHFHEVGGVDAIVDIVGSCICLELLGVDHVFALPPRVGGGFVTAAHGMIPIPAPATAELMAMARAPVRSMPPGHEHLDAELLTPTGAAILTTLADFSQPESLPERVGYGFGRRELPWPNALRVTLAEITGQAVEAGDNQELVIETNIDDMSPQGMELLMERLYREGALEVWVTPVQMKKQRPAVVVSALAQRKRIEALTEIFMLDSTTLGVRITPVERVKAGRSLAPVTTRWGDIRVKRKIWNDRVIDVMPEYDDCLRIAREHDRPIRQVWNEAHRIAEGWIGRSVESFDGQLV